MSICDRQTPKSYCAFILAARLATTARASHVCLALYRDVETDAGAGIHRIALTHEALAGGKVERLALGRWPTPRAIKLWLATKTLFVGEGLETTLAAAHARALPRRPCSVKKFSKIAIVSQLSPRCVPIRSTH